MGKLGRKKGIHVECCFAKISLNLMLNTNQNLSGDNRSKVSTFLHSEVLTAFWSFPSYLDDYLSWSPRSVSMIQPYIESPMKRCKGCPARSKLKQRPHRLDLLLCLREVRNLAIFYSLKHGYYIIARLTPILNSAQKRQHGKETDVLFKKHREKNSVEKVVPFF